MWWKTWKLRHSFKQLLILTPSLINFFIPVTLLILFILILLAILTILAIHGILYIYILLLWDHFLLFLYDPLSDPWFLSLIYLQLTLWTFVNVPIFQFFTSLIFFAAVLLLVDWIIIFSRFLVLLCCWPLFLYVFGF